MTKVLFTLDPSSTSRFVPLCYVDMSHPEATYLAECVEATFSTWVHAWRTYANLIDIPLAITITPEDYAKEQSQS